MHIINPFNAQELINESATGFPVVGALVEVVNSIYWLIGGFVGLSVILFLLRWWDARSTKKRLQNIEAAIQLISEKLDKLALKKPKSK